MSVKQLKVGKKGAKKVQKGGNVGTHAKMTRAKSVQKGGKKVAPFGHAPGKKGVKRGTKRS